MNMKQIQRTYLWQRRINTNGLTLFGSHNGRNKWCPKVNQTQWWTRWLNHTTKAGLCAWGGLNELGKFCPMNIVLSLCVQSGWCRLSKMKSSNLSHRVTTNFKVLCQLLPLLTWLIYTKSSNPKLMERSVMNFLSQNRNDVDLLCPYSSPTNVFQVIPYFNNSFNEK